MVENQRRHVPRRDDTCDIGFNQKAAEGIFFLRTRWAGEYER